MKNWITEGYPAIGKSLLTPRALLSCSLLPLFCLLLPFPLLSSPLEPVAGEKGTREESNKEKRERSNLLSPLPPLGGKREERASKTLFGVREGRAVVRLILLLLKSLCEMKV